MESSYDAVVVGSGFGGGITACRLAERGWRVCVLERGRRFSPGGFFDLRIMRDVAVMTGAGVGGGSLVYANVQLRAPDDVFEDPAWPAAIDATTLRPSQRPPRCQRPRAVADGRL
ncbi:MAG: NAD(P)-binding protein [Solirubrobacteraceae bacterium]